MDNNSAKRFKAASMFVGSKRPRFFKAKKGRSSSLTPSRAGRRSGTTPPLEVAEPGIIGSPDTIGGIYYFESRCTNF